MLRACSACGRIHDSRIICTKRQTYAKRDTREDSFRGSRAWQRKRETIRARDLSLCRLCLAAGRFSWANLSVHHIEPLVQAPELSLEDDNLITLCGPCHERAEAGLVPRAVLHELAALPPEVPPAPSDGP